jgi:hypothetical protein
MQFLSWYWSVFGVDFSNPMFWVAAIALEAFLVPIGAVVGYKWGLTSPQAYAVILVAGCAGCLVNLAF